MMQFSRLEFECACGLASQLPVSDRPEICFAGRSNVGKSSLINRIASRKSLARVSSRPGKTGTVNFYRLEGLRLVDLPGYGYAKVPIIERDRWSELMDGYFGGDRQISLVIQLIDFRHPPAQSDLQMLRFLRETGLPFALALTKSDKLNRTEREERLRALPAELEAFGDGVELLPCSAQSGEGIETLRQLLEAAAQREEVTP